METEQLIRDALQGDRDAFGKLVEEYWRFAVGIAFRWTSDFSEAEDIAQNAFIAAYSNMKTLRSTKNFPSWLRAIVINYARMSLRSRRTTPEGLFRDEFSLTANLSVTEDIPEKHALRKELTVEVGKALDGLSENYREVALLRYFADMTYQEISNALDIPTTTVSYRLLHANGLMRKELKHLMEESMDQISNPHDRAVGVKRILDDVAVACRLVAAEGFEAGEAALDAVCRLADDGAALHLEIGASLFSLFLQMGFDERVAERIIRETELAISLGYDGSTWSDGSPIDPWQPYASLALVYLHMGECEKSRTMFDKAKSFGQPYDINEGHLFGRQGYYEEALAFYRDMLDKHGDDDNGKLTEQCRENIAAYLTDLKRYDEALAEYNSMITDGIDPAFCSYYSAVIHARRDDYSSLLIALEQAVKGDAMYADWARKQHAFGKYQECPEFQAIIRQ